MWVRKKRGRERGSEKGRDRHVHVENKIRGYETKV